MTNAGQVPMNTSKIRIWQQESLIWWAGPRSMSLLYYLTWYNITLWFDIILCNDLIMFYTTHFFLICIFFYMILCIDFWYDVMLSKIIMSNMLLVPFPSCVWRIYFIYWYSSCKEELETSIVDVCMYLRIHFIINSLP